MVSYLISSTASPTALATGYFNTDSYMDIVVVNYYDATITIFLGYGNGTFRKGNTYSVGCSSAPSACTVGDLNSDSRIDVVVPNTAANNIAILFGNGDGTFQPRVLLSTGANTGPTDAFIGYINNDTRLDIAVANSNKDQVGFFLGNGNGTFQAQKTTSTGSGSTPFKLVMSDFNQDHLQDLAVALSGTNMASVLLGLGTNSFRAATTYITGSQPFGIDCADFNSDLIPDLAVPNAADSSVSILLRNDNGTFRIATQLTVGSGTYSSALVVIDLDQDGHPDVVVANYDDDCISVVFGRGDGSFQALSTISLAVGSSPNGIAVADFDKDGRLDVAVANDGANTVGILLRTC